MTAPAVAAGRFLAACAVGAAVGLLYGFGRPLRPRLTHLWDGITVIAALLGWIYIGFGICRGEVHFGGTAGMLLGAFAWECTVGRLLRPVFFGFWRVLWKILAFLWMPIEKIFIFFRKIFKKLFAFRRKWVTMEGDIGRKQKRRPGGVKHGKEAC